MIRSKIVPAAMIAALSLGSAATALAATGESEGSREIAAVLDAGTPIADAVAAAEQRTGGKALKAGIEAEDKASLYKITTVSKDRVTEVFVDPATGKVVRTEDEGMIDKLFGEDDDAGLVKARATLVSAIAAAEQKVGGKAVEAGFDGEDSAARFEVEVVRGKIVQKVIVDGTSGRAVKVLPASEDENDAD